jgi:hypothetical protein
MARARTARARLAPPPANEAERARHQMVLRSRLLDRDYAVKRVVGAAVKYHAEEQRTDNLHRARLSICKHDLMSALKYACETISKIGTPVSMDELEDEWLGVGIDDGDDE